MTLSLSCLFQRSVVEPERSLGRRFKNHVQGRLKRHIIHFLPLLMSESFCPRFEISVKFNAGGIFAFICPNPTPVAMQIAKPSHCKCSKKPFLRCQSHFYPCLTVRLLITRPRSDTPKFLLCLSVVSWRSMCRKCRAI